MQEMANFLKISKEIMKKMINEIDINGDGRITLEEWITYITDTKNEIQNNNEIIEIKNINDNLKYVDKPAVKIERKNNVLQEVIKDQIILKKGLTSELEVSE
mmetsp:Transcript_33916/g.28654  ORF Transcript_33916/g.28654 Transcript_33916/m.28654 type:complete len:102 (+) Transcript_33916:332-637(+)